MSDHAGSEVGSLEELAAIVASSVSTVCDFLRQSGNAQPSFAVDGPKEFPSAQASASVLQARNQLIAASRQLHFLALYPSEAAKWYTIYGTHDTSSLRWLYHFRIPQAVPLQGSIAVAELADKCKVEQRRLIRVLRHAMTNHWFCEPEPGRVAHSAMSSLIVTDDRIYGQIGYQTEVVFPSAAKVVEATERFGSSESHSNAAFNVAWDTEMQSMKWAMEDPVKAGWFAGLMKTYQQSSPFRMDHVVNGYDWKGLGAGLLVDVSATFPFRPDSHEKALNILIEACYQVGGNTGGVSIAIAQVAPDLKFIVQDQAGPVAKGEADLPASLKDRVSFHAHDFFTPNPVKEADAFLLRFILHDWPDEDALTILRGISSVMKPKTKLIIADSVVPPPGKLSYLQEKHLRTIDLTMLTMMNAMEREIADWEALISKADPSLRILRIEAPKDSALSIIEIIKVE
ncbi:hypothetical protein MBLNU459_g5246t1 [Dothideomycetes sp. NU459]